MSAHVEISHWSYRYPLHNQWAVDDLSLSIVAGERVLLTGRSGWGKSTILHAIAGLLDPDTEGGQSQGTVTIDGDDAHTVHGKVGLIMQDPEAQIIFTRVGDNATFGAENRAVPRDEIFERVQLAMLDVNLDKASTGITERTQAQQLSGGQAQRLAIASIIAMKPDVIVCDEPTANLDPQGMRDVVRSIDQAARSTGATLIVVDHNASLWLDIVDRHVELGDCPVSTFTSGQCAPAQPTDSNNDREVVLSVRDMSAGYTSSAGQTCIASGMSCDFYAGEIAAIMGDNGTGKTTVALTLAGLLPPLSGDVNVSDDVRAGADSADISQWSAQELSSRIQYVFQNPEHQFVTSRVVDEMASALAISHPDMVGDQLVELAKQKLEVYDLHEQTLDNPYSLSGGQKRRLTVACAIEAQPKILIVDEPTYGQDPHTWETLVRMFARLRDEGTCIIVITHDKQFVDVLSARVIEFAQASSDDNSSDDSHNASTNDRVEVRVEVTELRSRLRPEQVLSQSKIVARLNPLTRLLAGLIIGIPLLFSLDLVSASVALGLQLCIAFILGFRPRHIIKAIWPICIGACGATICVIIYNAQHDFTLAGATGLRVMAMGIATVMLTVGIDPTDLADAFSQQAKFSDRFVYGALAGFRLLPLLKVDLLCIQQARTIRGIRRANPIVRTYNDSVALLILAIRRSTTLALAMQARGFGMGKRTHTRISVMTYRDIIAYAISVSIPLIALSAAWMLGTFNLFGHY